MSGLPRTRKRHRTQKAGRSDSPRVEETCQCYNPARQERCPNKLYGKTFYCANHQECPQAPKNGAEPMYQPELYNSNPNVYKSHNCYSYSMNVIDPKLVNKCKRNSNKNTCRQSFHQPGALHGDRFTLNTEARRTCPIVEKLMIADVPAITKTSFYQSCPNRMSKIALVVDPGEDYHYYRQDADGLWSHKDGSNKVKRYDAMKKTIVNPKYAARDYTVQGSDLNYEDFCGFYCVPRYDTIHLGQGGSKVSQQTKKMRKLKKKLLKWWNGTSRRK